MATRKPQKTWTNREISKVRAAFAAGARCAAIAASLGRSYASVYGEARYRLLSYRYCRPQKGWTDEETDRMDALRYEGKTTTEIARALGRSLKSVRSKLYHGRRKARESSAPPPPESKYC